LSTLAVIIGGFLLGSLPFSAWITRYVLRVDIRAVGDGNPGMTNVLKAGGVKWGALALILDFVKGAIPVWIAWFNLGLDGLPLVAAALAPVLGHAYSPFLRFRGGKAVATSGGMWCGLTIWELPTIGGLLLAFWMTFIIGSGWVILFTMLSLLAYMLLTAKPSIFLIVWLFNTALLLWKYRADLQKLPALRGWFTRIALPWHSLS
jgi:glycerol-3-phosphate acyltransferase PlsY